MPVSEFWEMRLKDFFLKLCYYNNKKQREIEYYSNLVRMQTVALINIQLEKRHRIADPKKFWVFPWENREDGHSGSAATPDIGDVLKLSKLL